ncbi:hypothetical protein K3152_04590 [Qipengyuania sp. 1NDH17]|uniref:DUF1795 domain-containing protein n=1 Tax=Qipengyuania polymorpha TaxID=2867234 RepID=A0ABS7IVM2_9SPHN|nr:hypothetical protein [Qipengyuania polymorpha]MBX7457518.1 hypothetical protein [Qipengyuania polymorpha]
MIKPILAVALFALASPASAEDFARPAMSAELPSSLLGNDCRPHDMGKAKAVMCMGGSVLEEPNVGVTLTPVDKAMTLDDLKHHTRETFHESSLRQIIREKRVKLRHAPEAVVFEGVYNTNIGLRRTWVAYHDGVLIRVIVSAFSKKADGNYRDEILKAVFGPERFTAPANAEGASVDE